MVDRIYIRQKGVDNREKLCINSFMDLGLSGKIKDLQILDCYLLSHQISLKKLKQIGKAFTNPILEQFFINQIPLKNKFSYAIEISFLPGVTDNV